MRLERVRSWCALLDSGIDGRLLGSVVRGLGGPEGALDASDQVLLGSGLKPDQVGKVRLAQGDEVRLRRQLEVFEREGMQLLELGSAGYPGLLGQLMNPPPVLFVKGSLEDVDELAVALVGPRLATSYGLEVAKRLSRDFAPRFTVVSGAAVGVDSAAHAATMDAGGRTIAVLGCGIDQDYPVGNGELRGRIAGSGALVSQFTPLTKPETWHFPQRNYTLAGLSLAVVVVEASEESGALVTAHAAADEGRAVFAVPGDITRKNSRGTNGLLRAGATALTCAEDLLEDLEGLLTDRLRGLQVRRGVGAVGKVEVQEEVAGLGGMLLGCIRHESRSYDWLLAEFVPGVASMGDFTMALLNLEIEGRIKQMPGRVFCARA